MDLIIESVQAVHSCNSWFFDTIHALQRSRPKIRLAQGYQPYKVWTGIHQFRARMNRICLQLNIQVAYLAVWHKCFCRKTDCPPALSHIWNRQLAASMKQAIIMKQAIMDVCSFKVMGTQFFWGGVIFVISSKHSWQYCSSKVVSAL